MAKPIQFIPKPPSPEERVDASVQDNAPAIEESLLLLSELHQHGVLEVLIKLVRGGEGLVNEALHILTSEGTVSVQRNLIEVVKIVEQLDPNEVKILGDALVAGVSEGARDAAAGKTLGLSDLMGLMRDRDVQLALGAIFGILRGMGKAMKTAQE